MPTHKIVLASGNQGKLKELQSLLGGLSVELVTQSELEIEGAEETGLSFVENAILKARHASRASGLAAIADDSGLEVTALHGRPGIYSARFAEGTNDDQDAANNRKLLGQMEGLTTMDRDARFRCVLVYLRHWEDPSPVICQGSWEGRILHQPQGEGGFGYDPLFYVSGNDCSAAELSAEDKNRLSHRGQALQLLLNELRPIYNAE